MSQFKYSDIPDWDLQKVNRYVELIGLKNAYFKKNIDKIKEFLNKYRIDGEKLIWLISEPYEPLSLTGGHLSVVNKLKNLDSVLWKGLRWRYLLEPIILLSEAKLNSTINFNEEEGIVLNIIDDKQITNSRTDRVYGNKSYGYEIF